MDDDGRIYSPEASDYQRLGDWQTKLAAKRQRIRRNLAKNET